MPAFALAALKQWKLIGIGLLCLLLAIQSVRLGHAKNETERVKIANNELRAELKRISDAKDKQGETTKGTVKQAEDGERKAKPIADKIRSAPIVPGKCETPGIDLLRNEI